MSNPMPQMPGMPSLQKSSETENAGSVISSPVGEAKASPSVDLDVPEHEDVFKTPIVNSFDTDVDNLVATKKVPKHGIEVVALRKGFYNQNRINEDETFFCRSIEELGTWMKCLDPDMEKVHQANQKAKKEKAKK